LVLLSSWTPIRTRHGPNRTGRGGRTATSTSTPRGTTSVFLFEDIDENGVAEYSVVDGKQRLSTVFDFLNGEFPVSDTASITRFRGLSFVDLPPEVKRRFYGYQFAIEFLPSTDEGTLSNIFDRINRNVARLTPQELRHARFEGLFATKAEDLAEALEDLLPKDFPRIAPASKRQMKDVEFIAQLMLRSRP
jgi:hypothetical protein